MAFVQIVLAWLGRSLGSLLNTLFGWAVLAMFGRTFGKEHVLLTLLTAMAAFWPLLLLGIPFPTVAGYLIAFLPFPKMASEFLRALWITLAVAVPLFFGVVLTRMRPGRVAWSEYPRRMLIGFPAAAALAGGFLVVLFTAPFLRLLSLWRRREELHVPLVAEPERYEAISDQIDRAIREYRIPAERAEPPTWLTLPFHILVKLGRQAFPGIVAQPSYWRQGQLEIALYPHDILIRGPRRRVAWTRGALAEGLACGPGLATVGPAAQEIERRLHALWDEPDAPEAGARRMQDPREGLRRVVIDLRTQPIDTEDWQILYRKAEQLRHALEGDPLLLRLSEEEKETKDRSA